jgi:hypothetical protein
MVKALKRQDDAREQAKDFARPLSETQRDRCLASQPCADHRGNVIEMKRRQSWRIRELGDVLVREGFLTLDEQADVLGLGRSTTWTILRANHKAGLSASVINRMLAPPSSRRRPAPYVELQPVRFITPVVPSFV